MRASKNRIGDYVLLDRLGVGGMAEVFVAQREGPYGFSKKVALKRILPGLAADRRFVEMFCDEAKISAALNHPNIVQVVDFGECGGELFMAMELVEGLTVGRLLRLAASSKRPIPLSVALYIVQEILRGLDFAHEATDATGRPLNLVHRDVSPGNILLGYSGEVKLSDFGIVRSEIVARRTHPGELKGKMGYMSPEQVASLDVDRRSDLFTMGIVLAELLLLRPLFTGKSEIETISKIHRVDLGVLDRHGQGVPRAVRSVLDCALQRDRARRFATAAQFADALGNVVRSEGLALTAEQMSLWLRSIQSSGTVTQTPPESQRNVSIQTSKTEIPGPRRPESGARRSARRSARDHNVALRAADGTALGIVTLIELLGRVATGRVPLDAWTNLDGEGWKPLTQLPSFGKLAQRGAYQFDSVPPRPSKSGSDNPAVTRFEQRWLPSYLYEAIRRRATGLLAVSSGERARRIFFRKGKIEFVSSTDSSQLLGELLTAEALLSSEELDDCLLESMAAGRRLGEVLVGRGLLNASTLTRLLGEQREKRLASMFAWSSGSALFVAGQESAEPPAPGDGGYALITAAVRRGIGDDVLAHVLSPIRNSVVMPSGSDLDARSLGLTEPELRCLQSVLPGGARQGASLRAVVDAARNERLCRGREALHALFIGLSAGVITVPGWS